MDPVTLKSIPAIPEPFASPAPQSPIKKSDQDFGDLLQHAVEQVNRMQNEAMRLEDAVAGGENLSIHQAVIAGQKADLSFRLMMQVRNKLVEAYEEVMRMQV